MLWEKADAMARKMDDTYNAMESLAHNTRFEADVAKGAARSAEEDARYVAKLRTQALQIFLALTLANTAVCVGATALTCYLMR